MKTTMEKVANRAGVSKALVSRYLNAKPGVSQANKIKIKSAIDDLHYRLPGVKEVSAISIIVDGVSDFHHPLLTACSAVALAENNVLSIINCFNDIDIKIKAAKILSQGWVQGVMVYGSSISDKAVIDIFIQSKIPLVLIENDLPDTEVEKILVDNFQGQYNITKYVIDMGFKDIRMIPWDLSTRAGSERMAGFLAALREHNLMTGNNYIYPPEKPGFQGVFDIIERLHVHKDLPDVFICSGDTVAAHALISCDKLRIKVPEHLSITGFDGIPLNLLAPWTSMLTTMRQPLAEMGDFATKRLLTHIRNPDEAPQKTMFHSVLVSGGTVKNRGVNA